MNSEGGTLLIGVEDDGQVFGIEQDISTFSRQTRDEFEQHLFQVVENQLGSEFLQFLRIEYEQVQDRLVCKVEVLPSLSPVYVTSAQVQMFYTREGNSTRPHDMQSANSYIDMHWS